MTREGAKSFISVAKPGQWYQSDKDGKLHRWDDVSGSRNPANEDLYRGAQSTINQTFHVASDSGDAVIHAIKSRSHEAAHHVHRAMKEYAGNQAVV